MAETAYATCGQPTSRGACRAPCFGGSRKGACYRHAGLASTERQRSAVRENAVQHGFYQQGKFLTEEQRAVMQAARGVHDPERLVREEVALAFMWMQLTFRWECIKEKPSKAATRAFARLGRQVKRLASLESSYQAAPVGYSAWRAVTEVEEYRALLERLAREQAEAPRSGPDLQSDASGTSGTASATRSEVRP